MTLEFTEGQDISVRYSLLHQIGESPSSEAWLALDRSGSERVCLKIFEGKAEMLEQVRTAIDNSRGLIHANIVRNFDQGDADGNLYISSSYVKSAKPFNLENRNFTESWPVLEQLFTALEFAHSLGISHGHLQPGNLLIDGNGLLHITGFCLPTTLANNNADYLTEEVRSGQPADSADDIYSLGCLIFRLLTGRPWLSGGTFEANSPISAEVRQTVAVMLAPSQHDRLVNLNEAKELLGNYALGISNAKPIEIQQTTFDRSKAPETASLSPLPAHLSPRDRNQIPTSIVFMGLAALLVLAGFVFFILPNTQAIRNIPAEATGAASESAPAPAKREQPVEPPVQELAPLEIAQLEFLKNEGKLKATELLRSQVELEDLGVHLWAGATYHEIGQVADSGDSFYREEKFREAMNAYEEALNRLVELRASMPSVLDENLAAGEAAINAAEVESAITAWSIAHAIKPGNNHIKAQLQRAENLDQVLSFMKTGVFHEGELAFADALKAYEDAAGLDPKWQQAAEGVARVKSKIAKVNFDGAMSAGFSRLAVKNYAESKKAFTRAQAIFPKSLEPADGLLQIELAERMDAIEAHKSAATAFVQAEDWPQAIREYESVLKLDQTLVFASEGLLVANERLELERTLNRFLSQPTLMRDDEELNAARTAVVKASRVRGPGPLLKQQLSTLSRLVSVARIPITIELNSDNKTDIEIYRVGKYGQLGSTQVELYPGDYTIVGRRRGYRDIRRELTLLAGEATDPIYISCIEKI